MLKEKVPGLTRQMVYAFLVGLIVGGVVMGMVDATAEQPIFGSKASAPTRTIKYKPVNGDDKQVKQNTEDCMQGSFTC